MGRKQRASGRVKGRKGEPGGFLAESRFIKAVGSGQWAVLEQRGGSQRGVRSGQVRGAAAASGTRGDQASGHGAVSTVKHDEAAQAAYLCDLTLAASRRGNVGSASPAGVWPQGEPVLASSAGGLSRQSSP